LFNPSTDENVDDWPAHHAGCLHLRIPDAHPGRDVHCSANCDTHSHTCPNLHTHSNLHTHPNEYTEADRHTHAVADRDARAANRDAGKHAADAITWSARFCAGA